MTDLGWRFVTCFARAADDVGLRDDMVSAVDDVLRRSPEASAVPGGVPVPR